MSPRNCSVQCRFSGSTHFTSSAADCSTPASFAAARRISSGATTAMKGRRGILNGGLRISDLSDPNSVSKTLSEPKHFFVLGHAVFDIVAGDLLHALQSKAFDVETCDEDAVGHGHFERMRLEVVVL